MNLYFLVEGKRTESIIYPMWLSVLLPELSRTYDAFSITDNQYYLFDGGGYPNILKDMINALYDINEIGKYDYFIVCIDADDESIREREESVRKRIRDEGLELNFEVVVIVQKKCIETWFLGNRYMYTYKKTGAFSKFSGFYNVYINNPEHMDKPFGFDESTAQFHFRYLEAMLREKGIRYSKSRPYDVGREAYLKALIERCDDTDDLGSLRFFLNFCKRIRKEIKYGHV